MAWRIRIPLWVLLPGLAVSVVAFGAVAAGIIGIQQARGYLNRQSDSNLSACAGSVLSQHFTTGPTAGPAPSGACDIELLSAGGQLLTPPAPGQDPGPAIPAGPSWLAAHTTRPVTVLSAGAARSWQVLVEPVRYRPQRILFVYGPEGDVKYDISGQAGRGSAGLLVVMTGTAGLGRLPAQVATAAATALVLLAGAGLALTRAVLRPLRDASRFASGPAVISQQMDASRTAEAAARRSATEMADRLSQVSLELRTSVGVVRGFAEYCRQPGKPAPAAGHPMARRAADEITRMETLVARLTSPRDPEPADPAEPAEPEPPRWAHPVSRFCRSRASHM